MRSFSEIPDVVKNRWLGFLMWQFVCATSIYILVSSFLGTSSNSFLSSLASFLIFHLSSLMFSLSLFLTSTPQPEPSASVPELVAGILKASVKSLVGGFQTCLLLPEFRRRVGRTIRYLALIFICAASGFLCILSMCCNLESLLWSTISYAWLRGLAFGLVYGSHYVYKKRFILQFPILQRPPFFSFKIGLSSALKQAFELSLSSLVLCVLLSIFWRDHFMEGSTFGQLIIQEIRLFICISVISLHWEISRHLLEVLHTRRFFFAPALGSVAAELNSSEALVETIEQSSPGSLIQYLAFLDLCLVSESNFELWRRAALFEESGETYKRVLSSCLKPLEQLTLGLADVFEGFYPDNSTFSSQLHGPSESHKDQILNDAFDRFQLLAWCARTVAALTSRSRQEDRFGVAQLTGSNTVAVSTLLSCLLAVESSMGKKPSPPPSHLAGPGSIKWATTVQVGPRDAGTTVPSRRRSLAYRAKAFAMADVLRTAIYDMVSAFEEDMVATAKALTLQKNWISESKPLFGTKELLAQKLSLFLDYRAV